ncbi:MAG: hypothetical protein JW808_11495 [Victivallales bacterium]|nr:hypothetical protein [Victivallales bacterium]
MEQAEKFGLKSLSGALQTEELRCLWWPPHDRPVSPKYLRLMIKAIEGVDHKSPALWGYHLVDEPGTINYSRIAWYHSIMRSVDPGCRIYVNLHPGSDPELYIKEVLQCDMVGFDHYPIFFDGDSFITVNGKSENNLGAEDPGHVGFDKTSFLYDMARFRKAALKHDKLFIPTILSSGHDIKYDVNGDKYHRDYGNITEGKLRWQAYSALAYNADGIAWYKYFPTYLADGSPNKGYCRPSAIGYDWKPTEIYHWLKKINAEVFSIGSVIKQLKSMAVYEKRPTYFWREEHDNGICFFPAVDAVITDVKDGLVTVGVFVDDHGNDYLLVVNRDIKRQIQVSLSLSWEVMDKVVVYDRDEYKWGSVIWEKTKSPNKLTLELAPGDGEFLKITKAK